MNIYSINITAPILKDSPHRVSYNEFPIMCVTKKSHEEILNNESVKQTILDLITKIGLEMLDNTNINIKVINSDKQVLNIVEPVKKYYELWK